MAKASRSWTVEVRESDIIRAAKDWEPTHEDAPNETDLVVLRDLVGIRAGVGSSEMISLTWLRNQYVRIRKAGKLKAGRSRR